MDKWKSNCCGADVRTEGDTTRYYVCCKCGKPCDAVRVFIKGEGDED